MSGLGRVVPRPLRQWLRRHGGPLGLVVSVATDRREFVLTYDDGPEPGGTDAILPVLAEHGATATFFVLLTRVRRYPALLRDVVEAGHEIALHGVDHQPISQMSYAEVLRRTVDAKRELEDAVGAPIRWFRPPYGAQSLTSFRAVKNADLTPVLWGATAWDSREATPAQRCERALLNAAPGTILLCHDGYAGTLDGGRNDNRPEFERGALASTLLHAHAELGLQARSLTQVVNSGRAVRGIWFGR